MMEYSSYLKTVKTNEILHRKLDPYLFHKYKDIHHSVKLNKSSHEILFRKNRDELIRQLDSSGSNESISMYSNIIMSLLAFGRQKEVIELCNKNEISWEDFEKKICKWTDVETKDFLNAQMKKTMKKDFLQ